MQLNVCHTLYSWHKLLKHSPTLPDIPMIFPNLLFIPCYNQSLFISIYHLIMQAYISQQLFTWKPPPPTPP